MRTLDEDTGVFSVLQIHKFVYNSHYFEMHVHICIIKESVIKLNVKLQFNKTAHFFNSGYLYDINRQNDLRSVLLIPPMGLRSALEQSYLVMYPRKLK